MIEEPDGEPVPFLPGRELAEADLLDGGGKGLEPVQEADGHRARQLQRLPYGVFGHAPRREHHGAPRPAHRADELRVLHVRGVDLVPVRALVLGQPQRGHVERLHQQREPGGLGRAQDLAPFLLAQLDLVEVLAAGMAAHDEEVGAEELELDPVRAHLERGLQHPERAVGLAAVRGGHLGQDEAGLAFADGAAAQREGRGPHGVLTLPWPPAAAARPARGTPATARTRSRMRAVAAPSAPKAISER